MKKFPEYSLSLLLKKLILLLVKVDQLVKFQHNKKLQLQKKEIKLLPPQQLQLFIRHLINPTTELVVDSQLSSNKQLLIMEEQQLPQQLRFTAQLLLKELIQEDQDLAVLSKIHQPRDYKVDLR